MMPVRACVRWVVFSLLAHSTAAAQPPKAGVTLLSRAVERSGGDSALRAIRTVRYEYATQWMRTSFENLPAPAASGGETNVDTRDYVQRIWRYERRFSGSPNMIRDVVRDSVAITDFGRGWEPLSGAYVQERDELFLAAPEQLLIRALDAARAGHARVGVDTTIGGRLHARIMVALDDRDISMFVRRSDAQLTGMRYRAGQPWDFGLAAFGDMEVETWYSRWTVVGHYVVPFDIAINRVGRPYKRLSFTRAQFQVPIVEDSVSVPDAIRARYLSEQRRAMFDMPVDSVRNGPDGLVTFGVPGTPMGAVKNRTGWLVYGAGAAALITERAITRLRTTGTAISAAIVGTMSVAGAGGAPAMSRAGIPVFAAATARPYLTAMFVHQGIPLRHITWITQSGWHTVAGDSVWIEPIDLPDLEGSLIVWDPKRQWLYAGDAPNPAQMRAALTHAGVRGWTVVRMFVRGSATPVADARKLAGLP